MTDQSNQTHAIIRGQFTTADLHSLADCDEAAQEARAAC